MGRSVIDRAGIRAEKQEHRGRDHRADQRTRDIAARIAGFLGQRSGGFESSEKQNAEKQRAEKFATVRVVPIKDRPCVGRTGVNDRRGPSQQERNDRDPDNDQLHLRGDRGAADIEPPGCEANEQSTRPPREIDAEIELGKSRGQIAYRDGESGRAGKKQREHVDAEGNKPCSPTPGPRNVITHGPGPARLGRVISDHEGEGDHANGGEQHGQRTDRAGQRGHDAEKERDVDERADAKALADQLHQAEARGSEFSGGTLRGAHTRRLAGFHVRGRNDRTVTALPRECKVDRAVPAR